MTFTIAPLPPKKCQRCDQLVSHGVYDTIGRTMFEGCYDHCSLFIEQRERTEQAYRTAMKNISRR